MYLRQVAMQYRVSQAITTLMYPLHVVSRNHRYSGATYPYCIFAANGKPSLVRTRRIQKYPPRETLLVQQVKNDCRGPGIRVFWIRW
jgi:hypothetical protein